MPRYTYTCTKCEKESARIVAVSMRDAVQLCTCGASMSRKIPKPAVSTPLDTSYQVGYTPKDADMIIGADADSRWVAHEERVSARHARYREQPGYKEQMITTEGGVDIGQTLGDSDRQAISSAYSRELSEGITPKSSVDVGTAAVVNSINNGADL